MRKPIDIYEPSLRVDTSYLLMLIDHNERKGSFERAAALSSLAHSPQSEQEFDEGCAMYLAMVDKDIEEERVGL